MNETPTPPIMTNKSQKVVGIMSGTSVDTLDIALIEIHEEGEQPPNLLNFQEYNYPKKLRQQLINLSNSSHRAVISLDEFSRLNSYLGFYYAKHVNEFLSKSGVLPEDILCIGSHGQTISHTPNTSFNPNSDGYMKASASLQIGDGDCIAKTTGITTVSDFRMADIAAGGEGAPLAPACHQLFFGNSAPRVVVINLGGICNITFLERDNPSATIAFDTGPANMVLDGLVSRFSRGKRHYDEGGNTAQQGLPNKELLKVILEDPYFRQKAPKSCGRREFGEEFINEFIIKGDRLLLSQEDILRSALEVTVLSLQNALSKQVRFKPRPTDLVVCMGGGTRNQFLMQRILEELSPARVVTSDEMGINPSAFEAICFGWLGYLCMKGKPFSLPTITGASCQNIYGKVSFGRCYGD